MSTCQLMTLYVEDPAEPHLARKHVDLVSAPAEALSPDVDSADLARHPMMLRLRNQELSDVFRLWSFPVEVRHYYLRSC